MLRKKRAFANFSEIFFGSTDHTQRPASARGRARGFPVPGLPDPSEGGAASGWTRKNHEKWLEYDWRIYWKKKHVDVFNAEKIDRGRRMSEVFPSAAVLPLASPGQGRVKWAAILQVSGRLKDVAMIESSTIHLNSHVSTAISILAPISFHRYP